MLNKFLLFITLCFSLFNLEAQEKNNIKLGLETGFLLISESENLGLFINIEPKIRVSESAFIGLRSGITLNSHVFEIYDTTQFNINKEHDNAIISFIPTIDYYFYENTYCPYIGFGVSINISSYPYDVYQIDRLNSIEAVVAGRVNKRIGLLLRGGFEKKKFRLGLEYNIIPKGEIEVQDRRIIGQISNSYLGISVGFIFGTRNKKMAAKKP